MYCEPLQQSRSWTFNQQQKSPLTLSSPLFIFYDIKIIHNFKILNSLKEEKRKPSVCEIKSTGNIPHWTSTPEQGWGELVLLYEDLDWGFNASWRVRGHWITSLSSFKPVPVLPLWPQRGRWPRVHHLSEKMAVGLGTQNTTLPI